MPVIWSAAIVAYVALIVVTVAGFVAYGRRLKRYRPPHLPDPRLPAAAVILSLRGGDAALRKMLDRLVEQKYPRYRIYVVVDHPRDPVLPIVSAWQRRKHRVPVQVEMLRERLPWCTLKFSAVRQVLAGLPPEIGVVALVDGDADPYANWLRDLVTPLVENERVCASTGNRWYFPTAGGFGGWCRFVFNGCSLPFMDAGAHSWGGSLALRREFVDSPEFREAFGEGRWPTEEQTVFRASRKRGEKVVVSPHVLLWNRESVATAECFTYIARQLFWARLYYPYWFSILVHGVGTCALTIASLYGMFRVVTMPAVETGWLAVFLLGLTYWALIVGLLGWLHRQVRREVMPRQGRTLPPLDVSRLAALTIATPFSLFVYAAAGVKARLARAVSWRGVRYVVVPPHGIQLTTYWPLPEVASPERSPATKLATVPTV